MTLRARRKNDTQGEVGGFLRQRGFEFEFFAAGCQNGFEFDFCLIDEFAGSRTVLLRQRAKLFHQCGEFSVRAVQLPFACSSAGRSDAAFKSAIADCLSGSISFRSNAMMYF